MTRCNVHDSNCMSVWISDTLNIQSWQQLCVCVCLLGVRAGPEDNYPHVTGEKARTQHESSLGTTELDHSTARIEMTFAETV